jgi:hypothetical protein
MKTITLLITSFFFSSIVIADVWQKPPYTADEGHIQEEMEEDIERQEMESRHQDEGIQSPKKNPDADKQGNLEESLDQEKDDKELAP